jgi:hypothetical protein
LEHTLRSQQQVGANMQPNNWKNLCFCILLAFCSASWYCTKLDKVLAKIETQSQHQPLQAIDDNVAVAKEAATSNLCQQQDLQVKSQQSSVNCQPFGKSSTYAQVVIPTQPNSTSQIPIAQTNPQQISPVPENTQQNPPQLESQPTLDLTSPPPATIEQKLPELQIDKLQSQEDLKRRLRDSKQPPTDLTIRGELGNLRLLQQPLEQLEPPSLEPQKPEYEPVGYLLGYVGYFHTNNLFASEVNPIEDGLVFSGLTLASASFPVGKKTYINGAIDGNLIRYANQGKYNYNQVRLNVGLYQQLTSRMYGEIGWSNQQLFYAKDLNLIGNEFDAGDRFLNEHSVRLSLGRRDSLNSRLTLDSLYEFRASFSEPESRSRLTNSLSLSLNYYLQKSMLVGLNYQLNYSDFTQRRREDLYHRLYAQLTYGLDNYSNVNLQGGVSLGDSTERDLNFNGWFFSLNYSWELGKF